MCPVSRADRSEAGQVELDDHHGEGSLNVISSVSVQKSCSFWELFWGRKAAPKVGPRLRSDVRHDPENGARKGPKFRTREFCFLLRSSTAAHDIYKVCVCTSPWLARFALAKLSSKFRNSGLGIVGFSERAHIRDVCGRCCCLGLGALVLHTLQAGIRRVMCGFIFYGRSLSAQVRK